MNFDVSPTLRIQKIHVIGFLLRNQLKTTFPANVLHGDITRGLPVQPNSCDGLFCSHTLEHLSLNDFRKALINSFLILKPGGVFRCIVPDLEFSARKYVGQLDRNEKSASISFIESTLLGINERPRGLKELIKSYFGNSHHLWMWDRYSLTEELEKVGFKEIRECKFNDSPDEMFLHVEAEGRFKNAVALECRK
jgi:ubiquinone/menaquinone biosynthesis C-methylase UbiE